MSLEQLQREIDAAAPASPYLVTVGADGRPHSVSVSVAWERDTLVAGAGNTTFTNAVTRPLVSLVWPPSEVGGFSLIVDATAAAAEHRDRVLVLTPTSAVLHRTVPADSGSSVGASDCRPVTRP